MEENKITNASRSTLIDSANYEVNGPIVSCDVYSLGYGWTQSGRILGPARTQWGEVFLGRSLNGNGLNSLFRIGMTRDSIISFERSQFINKNLKNGTFRLYGNKGLSSGTDAVNTLALDVTINRGTIDVKFPTDPWGSKKSEEVNRYVTPRGANFKENDTVTILGSSIGGSDVKDDINLTVSKIGVNIFYCEPFNDGNILVEVIDGETATKGTMFSGSNYQVGEKILITGSSVVMITTDGITSRPGVNGVDDVILIITEIKRTPQEKVDNVELKYDRHDRVIYIPSSVALQRTRDTAKNNITAATVVYAAGSGGVIYEKGEIANIGNKNAYRYSQIQRNNKDIIIYFDGKLNSVVDDYKNRFLSTYFYFGESDREIEYTTTFIKGENDSIKVSFVETLPYDTVIKMDLEVLDINENWIRLGKTAGREPAYVGYILDPANPGDNTFFTDNIIETSQLVDESYNNLILTKDSIEGKLSVNVGDIITRIGIPLPILDDEYDITDDMINNSQFVITAVINELDYNIDYEGGSHTITYNNFSPETLNTAMILDGSFNITILDSNTARTGVIEENPLGDSINTRYLFHTLTTPFTYNGNDILITYWIDTPIGTFNTITKIYSFQDFLEGDNKEVINMSSANGYMGTDNTPGLAIALSHRVSF